MSDPADLGQLKDARKTHGENHTGIIIYDPTEPRSVYNLVSEEMQEAMSQIHPDLMRYKFKTLEHKLGPEERDYQLRVAFWREYNFCQDNMYRSISLSAVTKGICSRTYFYESVLRDPLRLAFILYPVTDMQVAMLEMMDLGLREMRKILKMPNSGKKGANLPVIREKIKIVALLQNRTQGAVTQRLSSEHKHMHVHTQVQEAPKSLDEINREINKIDREVKQVTQKGLEAMPQAQGVQPIANSLSEDRDD